VVVLTVLPDGPAKAKWLSEGEKAVVLAEQRRGREGGGDTHLSKAFFHPQVLLSILVYFLHQIAFYGVTFFLPAIIRSWGKLSELQIGLLTGLPWLCAFIGALAAGLGFLNALGVTGGFVGPYVMGAIEQGTGQASNGLIFMSISMALGGIVSLLLRYPHQDLGRGAEVTRRADGASATPPG
jgi:hypothetical protein